MFDLWKCKWLEHSIQQKYNQVNGQNTIRVKYISHKIMDFVGI